MRPTGQVPKSTSRSLTSRPLLFEPLLICYSHLRWNFVYQRPQHLLSRAAQSHRVLFWEEPIRREVPVPTLELREDGPVTVAVPIIPVHFDEARAIGAQRALLDTLLDELDDGSPVVAWYYTPMALAFSGHLVPDLCIYDCMDELSSFKGASPQLRELERLLMARADLVFTGGISLYEAKRDRHRSVHAFPSSIDTAHFKTARAPSRQDPADQAAIPRPRIGFFGVIDERMDIGLVGDLAAMRPDWHFVMLGPVVKIDPADLPRGANLHWLGQKSYAELPAYLGGWDVGFMPFAINEATRFISPTKTPEFLAAGLPVVSTPIRDVVRTYGPSTSDLVAIAGDASGFAGAIDDALNPRDPAWLDKVDRALAAGSWDSTWAAMAKRMHEARDPAHTAPRTVRLQPEEGTRV